MEHVAFLRNVNQGQRGQPSTADIVAAFGAAGASDIRTFQSNGTVVCASSTPDDVGDRVPEHLATSSGFGALVFTRELVFIEQVVERHAGAADFVRHELTLFAPDAVPADEAELARQASKRRCAVVEHGAGWAVVANDADRQSNGTPTIEAAAGTPASSRGLPTLLRLVDRFGR